MDPAVAVPLLLTSIFLTGGIFGYAVRAAISWSRRRRYGW
jgi:hypothetical protein